VSFAERCEAYAAATREFLDIAGALDESIIDMSVGDEWTPRQVLHHMADSEMQSAVRLRRLIAEAPGTLIQGYDESAWAQHPALGYRSADWRPAVALVGAIRASSYEVLCRLDETYLDRAGVHSESGAYSLDQWLDIYTRHPHEHLAQIRSVLAN
jgi:hypothetical protein